MSAFDVAPSFFLQHNGTRVYPLISPKTIGSLESLPIWKLVDKIGQMSLLVLASWERYVTEQKQTNIKFGQSLKSVHNNCAFLLAPFQENDNKIHLLLQKDSARAKQHMLKYKKNIKLISWNAPRFLSLENNKKPIYGENLSRGYLKVQTTHANFYFHHMHHWWYDGGK